MPNAVGQLYVIAAPSGAGKTSLVKALTDSTADISVSISHTTRPKRNGEINGINYHFIDKTQFEKMLTANDFLEHATIFDNLYGTSKSWVADTLKTGKDVILEIDWQGQQQIKKLFPQVASIFILPPSLKDLKSRLVNRNQDHPEVIQKRLADVKESVSHIHEFDYIILNDEFDAALRDITTVIMAGRLRQENQSLKYQSLIHSLLEI